jgi:hypothetical protein
MFGLIDQSPPARTRAPSVALLALVATVSIAGCAVGEDSSPATSAPVAPSVSGTPGSSISSGRPSPTTPSQVPSSTRPFPSVLPGLADWTVISPDAVEIDVVDGAIRLTLARRALWFQNQRGVLVGQSVTGDFTAVASVSTATRAGDPLTPPPGHTVELAGLMARSEESARESSVFVVVGTDANGLSVETKSTRDGDSHFEGPDWASPAADLRLCRSGSVFSAWKRPAGSGDPWTLAARWDRPDLPTTLRVGPNIYSDGPPDLVATIAGLAIRAGSSGCTG